MELRLPTPEQLKTAYDQDLRESFPPAELKPLRAIESMWGLGQYRPWCLFDDDCLVGEAFLWLGHPGWALLDYLCVSPGWRNDGFGGEMLRLLPQVEAPGTVIFAESEAPIHAPSPEMAKRRLGFYARNGCRLAGYDTDIFGVHYKTLYLADREVADGELMAEHRFVYENAFSPEKYARYIRIPRDPEAPAKFQSVWDQ
jgi:GNAT superfamily N-acetyltransferase